jgi:hypothetical protein
VTAKTALRSGSSQHGKARRASVRLTGVVDVDRSVEARELVVELAAEPDVHVGVARLERLARHEGHALSLTVELDGALETPAGDRHPRLVDLEVLGVEHHAIDGLDDLDGHRLLATERGSVEIGLHPQLVAAGKDGPGQPVVVLGR